MRNACRPSWVLVVLSVVLAGCTASVPLPARGSLSWRAAPMPDWEVAFRHGDPRWRGADGAASVPLGRSRTLWLFGDTWITDGTVPGRQGGRVIRNSLAIQEIAGGRPGRVEFFWRRAEQGPAAAFPAGEEPGWLWPMSGVRIGSCLYLFFGRFVPSRSVLGFALGGAVLLRVPNPDDLPEQWRIDSFRVPFYRHDPAGDLLFGVATLVHDGWVYVYGVREDWTRGVEGRSVLVARVGLDAFRNVDFSAWRFFSGDTWEARADASAALFWGAASEMSVSSMPASGRFLAVYNSCGVSERIVARLAPSPEGPWGEPILLYRCPEAAWKEDYFCYAGKAHPELARNEREIVVTYAVNSWRPEDLVQDLRIYWPRFVRVVQE